MADGGLPIRRRVPWQSLWLHGLLLGTVLLAILPLVGTRGLVLNDEGAALIQVEQLHERGTWFMPSPLPVADPAGEYFALDRSTHTERGFAPLLKLPAYPLALTIASKVGGRTAIAVLGVLGTVLASVFAALVARSIRPDSARWTLWVTGLCSPLFFDAYLVVAHSLAAAAVGGAAVASIRFVRTGRTADLVLGCFAACCAATLRNETVLLGGAFWFSANVVAWRRRRRRRRSDSPADRRLLVAGWAVGGVVAVAAGVNRKVVDVLAPRTLPTNVDPIASDGFAVDRIRGFVATWLTPGYGDGVATVLPPVVFAALAFWVGTTLRRRSGDRRVWIVVTTAVALAGSGWLLFAGASIVPGIVMAFPLLLVAASVWRRSMLENLATQVIVGTIGVFVLAVIATQYPVGGTTEWGARYLAVGVPLVVPVVVIAVMTARAKLSARVAPAASLALALIAIVPAGVAVQALRTTHHQWDRTIDQMIARAAGTDPGDGGSPVIVTDLVPMPRFTATRFSDARWLASDEARLQALFDRLHDIGVEEFLYVTVDGPVPDSNGWSVVGCRPLGAGDLLFNACTIGRSER